MLLVPTPLQVPNRLPPGLAGAWGYWLRGGLVRNLAGDTDGTTTGGVTFEPSVLGPALKFDGTGYVTTDIISTATNNFSVVVLGQRSTGGVFHTAVSNWATGTNVGWMLQITNTNFVQFYTVGSGWKVSALSVDTNPHTLGITFTSGNQLTFCRDGTLEGPYTHGAATASSNSILLGFARVGGANPWIGSMAGVWFFRPALTPAALAAFCRDPWALSRVPDVLWAPEPAPSYNPTRMLLAA